MHTISPDNSERDFTTLSIDEKKAHIMSWFKWTDFPIENIEDITEIKTIGDCSISFWYNNKLCNCPTREKFDTDQATVFETESFDVLMLKLHISNKLQQCFNFMTPSQEDGLISI